MPDATRAAALRAARARFQGTIDVVKANVAGAGERHVIASLVRDRDRLEHGIATVIRATRNGDAQAVSEIQTNRVDPASADIRRLINGEIGTYGVAAKASVAASRAAGARLGLVAFITATLAAAVTVAALRMVRLRRRLADAHRREVERLRTAALRDSLTGLRNHRSFQEDMLLAVQDERFGHLLVVDMDGLKSVNDEFGHQAGDDLLVKVAAALESASGLHVAVPYRVGGDEFAVLTPPDADPTAIAAAIHAACGQSSSPPPAVTVGFASWLNGTATHELVRRADLALITAKADGVATCRYEAHLENAPSRAEVERAELCVLLDTPRAIVPVFQPIFDLRSRDIVGYEALTRFPVDAGHSTQGWFELAHRHGLAVELEAAAVQAALAVPGRPAGVSLSLNISPEVLLTGRDQLGLPDDLTAITIEVTEDALVTEGVDLELALNDLRARGARIAVDDAGAGYAGFAQLARIRPDIIKLDRSLVRNVNTEPTKAAVIRAFVGYARDTGAIICAEGIETAGELGAVAHLGAATGQGFLLGRPDPHWMTLPQTTTLATPEPHARVIQLRPAASA